MPPDWEQVKPLFDEALGLPGERRRAWLEQACRGSERLLSEVESLLAAHERAGAFLETAAAGEAPQPQERLLGTRLGPYLLESVLGRGGMGIVYRARREAPAREVAIKVVAAAGSEAVLRRFRAESQILARFDHPNVARMFDVGQAPDGRPYFVMELVQGVPIDRHCGASGLDLPGRLRLFLKVCEAVAYAHARLVVHRDIKPANVLVDAGGQPRLLDFGIARLLDDELGQSATETGLRLMTPEYASPEQVRGEPATVATDVHALGLLLYLMLTGRSPFRLRSTSAAELVRVVCGQDPPLPSSLGPPSPADGARRAGFEPCEPTRRLARMLRGDLDAIVARALRKEPQHRYASVAQLADDVRSELEGRPVLAREGRWRYRLGKFVRRHRLPVALGASLMLALLGGLLATVWQARVAQLERARAEKRFADVRRLATSFLFDFHDAIVDLPGSTRARELVVKQALEYLDGLAQEAGDDQQLRLELARAYQRVGQVQGVPGQPNLGDAAGARRSLSRAFDLLGARVPRSEGAAFATARLDVHIDLARTLVQAGDHDRALGLLRRAAAEEAPPATESTPESARVRVRLLRALATELQRRGELVEAEAAARTMVALAGQALARWPREPVTLRGSSQAHQKLAAIQAERGDFGEARQNARVSLEAARAALQPDDTGSMRALVSPLLMLAELDGTSANVEDLESASRSFAEALELSERLAAQDPGNKQAARDVAAVLGLWCTQLNAAAVRARPRDVCGEALRAAERAYDPRDATAVFNVAIGRLQLARERELLGDLRGALRLYASAQADFAAPVLAGGGRETRDNRAYVLAATARVRLALGQAGEAREAAREALAFLSLEPGRQEGVEMLDLRVRIHTSLARATQLLARGHTDPAACDALEPGIAPADALRALVPRARYLAATLADFDALRKTCLR